MWAALWARIHGWVAMVAAVLTVLVGAYAAGARHARKAAEAERNTQALKARRVRDETVVAVDALDDDTARKLARSRMRSGR